MPWGRRTGNAVGEICWKMNIEEATFYCWKRVYVGMGVFEIRQLKQLEDENTKLKRLVADLRLDKTMLEDPKKKAVKPARCRELLRHLEMTYAVSERRACTASGFGRASHRYTSRRDPSVPIRLWLKELAQARVRYGYRKLILLQREGRRAKHKKIYRIYTEEGLSIRTRSPRRQPSCRYRIGRSAAAGINDIWAMDCMADRLFDGRTFRIMDDRRLPHARPLSTASRTNLLAYQVIEELDRNVRLRGEPQSLRVDNGPGFRGCMLDQRAYLALEFSRPGKSTDNALIEAFNSRPRQECLNASWFLSMTDARTRIEDWRIDYNQNQPHTSLGGLTPEAFAAQLNPARIIASWSDQRRGEF